MIKKQNKYLHNVYAISVVNLSSLEGKFYATDAKHKALKRKHDDGIQEEENVTGDANMVDAALDGNDLSGISGDDEVDCEQSPTEEAETLMDKLLTSAGERSIFTSLEPGRIN